MSAYADIHHFDSRNNTVKDDEGDLRLGYYFQLLDGLDALTELIGPYGSKDECEDAAIEEFDELAA